MKNIIGIFTLCLVFATVARAQSVSKKYCYEIPELEIFNDGEAYDWDTLFFQKDALNELNQIIEKKGNDKPSFFNSLVVNNLRLFHSACNKKSDSTEYKILIRFYNNTRGTSFSTDFNLHDKTIDNIVGDFKSTLVVDSLFGQMVSFMLMGPYKGTMLKSIPDGFELKDTLKLDIGNLKLFEKGRNAILVLEKKEKLQWIVDLNEEVGFYESSFSNVRQHMLGYTIWINNGGDGMEVHLRENGDFRFYLVNPF